MKNFIRIAFNKSTIYLINVPLQIVGKDKETQPAAIRLQHRQLPRAGPLRLGQRQRSDAGGRRLLLHQRGIVLRRLSDHLPDLRKPPPIR